MGLDYQNLAATTGKQCARRQSGNAGAHDHDMMVVIVARPSAEIWNVPRSRVAADGRSCYHFPI
jgi:hypothetical protein